jgi:hypothetical protein
MTTMASQWIETPDAWHMPAAYWFWHHLPDDEQIREQIGQMRNAGIHSFQVQARMAYPIEGYLDDDYLRACRIAVEEAARLGMMVGVYDDYNWQTGHAAGRAVAGHDELRERMLFWTSGVLNQGAAELSVSGIRSATENLGPAGMAWHYEGSVALWSDWEIAFAFAGDQDVTDAARLVDEGEEGCLVAVAVGLPDGTPVTVFVAARSTTSRLVNFVDAEAARRFVEVGYQPFHDVLGDFFGSTITYFFFDQPHANFYSWAEQHGNLRSAVPYQSDLPGLIRERWPGGYPRVLRALLEGDDASTLSDRAQFYEFFSSHSMSIFLGALRDWTVEKGVALSGHEVLAHVGGWDLAGAFDEWDLRVNFGVDYFAIDGFRSLTGVDAQDSVPQLSAKLGDSVARAHGRSGTIVEQYFANAPTGSGHYAGHWGLSLAELRLAALRHHLLGMRQLLFHGFYQTDGYDDDPRMFSNPRFDFPPGENFEPWFAEFHADFAIESGRLSEFLDEAEPVCDVAVLYPLRTVWAEGQSGPQARQVGAWCKSLSDAGYGFHLVDERDVESAEIRDGRLWFGTRGYRALVLAGVSVLRSAATIRHLAAALDDGVTVLASGATPRAYQHGPQTAEADWSALASFRHLDEPPTGREDLRRLVGRPGEGGAHIETDDGAQLRSWSGRCGTQLRAVVLNEGTSPTKARVTFPAGPVARLDLATAQIVNCDGPVVDLELDPQEIAVLLSGVEAPSGDPRLRWSPPTALKGPWTLEILDVATGGAAHTREIDPAVGWEQQGLAKFSGTAVYRTGLQLDVATDLLVEVNDIAGSATLLVNRSECGRRGWGPFRWHVPASALRSGPNDIALRVSSTAANRYYAGTRFRDAPEPAGLLAVPTIRTSEET